MNAVLALSHPCFREHDTGPNHPECADRMDAVEAGLRAGNLTARLTWERPEPVSREQLLRIHGVEYVDHLLALDGQSARLDPDTVVSPGTLPAALCAAGAAVRGVDAVLSGKFRHAVSLARPPGHHACRDRSMGFCLFNNIAVAAARALNAHGLQKVVILDIDVHHGNGTQEIFYSSSQVTYCSIHQSPWYPGTGALEETGEGMGRGHTINLPLPGGMGDPDYLYSNRELFLPLITKIRPQMVLVSAGFDAHLLDPLADMSVTTAGFGFLYRELFHVLESIDCPSVMVLEGGYAPQALSEGVSTMVEAALDPASGAETPPPALPHGDTVRLVAAAKHLASLRE